MTEKAALLPQGAKASAWPDLDAVARGSLVTQFLSLNPNVSPSGVIDFEASREPLFTDETTGEFVSLAGQRFTGPGGSVPLEVRITQGVRAVPVWAWALIGGGLVLAVIAK